MKTLTTTTIHVLLLLFIFPEMNGFAQVTLEKSYDHSLSVTKINQSEYKYFLMDVGSGQCRIYNPDHSLWKTINIALPANYYLFDIKFVTQNLFNSDNFVELWYSAYEYTTQETGRYTSGIISESGFVLVSIPGGLYAYINKAGEDVYKLAVYAYDNTVVPGTVKTYIYALPASSTAAAHVSAALAEPYPNPSEGSITLPLGSGYGNAILQVISVTSQVMFEKAISGEPSYRLNTGGWKPGVYSYRVVRGNEPPATKQFIVR